MFVVEQANSKKGGPSRHLHVSQDELFMSWKGSIFSKLARTAFT